MNRIFTTMALLAIPAMAFVAGCGGGSNDAPHHIRFTEETTLNQNLTGIWTVSAEVESTMEQLNLAGERYSYTGISDSAIFIVDNGGTDIHIDGCGDTATDVIVNDTIIRFKIADTAYQLTRHSNTRLSGTLDSYSSYHDTIYASTGRATLIKVAGLSGTPEHPDIEIGTLQFTYNGAGIPASKFECFSYFDGMVTKMEDGQTKSMPIHSIFAGNRQGSDYFFIDDDGKHVHFDLNQGPISLSLDSDEEDTRIGFSESVGTDRMKVDFDVSGPADYWDRSGNTVEASGTLELHF